MRKAFLFLLSILWNTVFRWIYIFFSPLPFSSLLFIAVCMAFSDNQFTFLQFFFLGMALVTASCTMSRTTGQSSSGSLSDRIPWIYTYLNAEFQRIARRDKKAFLRDQCKETEETNRMGKTRDLFKKIRDTKETFHAKMGSIKDWNSKDLTEAEDMKKKWQEYTEELYKKHLHDPDKWPT